MKEALETTEELYIQALDLKDCVINSVKNKVREILEADFLVLYYFYYFTYNRILNTPFPITTDSDPCTFSFH